MQIFHGDILYSVDNTRLIVKEDAYILVKDGIIEDILDHLPEALRNIPLTDFGRDLIIPAFSDLHVHAPQYMELGSGMDLLLYDWLNQYTFPEEAKFKDTAYAERIYPLFTKTLLKNGTLHASVFSSLHTDATNVLFEELEKAHLSAFVGKVNMDRNVPDYLSETTEESLRETERFLSCHSNSKDVRPILTPRFAPTCTWEVLEGLGKLGEKYGCGMQTHVVESKWEAGEARRLFPECSSDAQIYEKAGLLANGPSIFAHVIFPTNDDLKVMKRNKVVAVHCPEATVNVIAGIMPFHHLKAEENLPIALGSDIGAGGHAAVYKQIARAIQLSKLKEFYEGEPNKVLTLANVFHAATKEGGKVFGKVGSFEKGYHFDALVLSHLEEADIKLSPEKRLERFCYLGDDRNITHRYKNGVELFCQ